MCDKNMECTNNDREICDLCQQSDINLLKPKLYLKKVNCPLLLGFEIEDDQCWHCHRKSQCESEGVFK
jgi:hypothetical protein